MTKCASQTRLSNCGGDFTRTLPKSYLEVVERYRASVGEPFPHSLVNVLGYYAKFEWFEDAVVKAARALSSNEKRHPHQYRFPNQVLEKVRSELSSVDLGCCRSFAELFDKIQKGIQGIHGIGPLMVYDTALRLGSAQGLEPEMVYLQRGSKEGAVALGIPHFKTKVAMSELPVEFHVLKPCEAEDCLCIFKDALKKIS